jgi:ribosomal protein S18 acetylase RimI-like enzyme
VGRSLSNHLPKGFPVQSRIQNYLRAVAPLGREQVRIGPFLATISPKSDNPYLNYAIPDDGADPTAGEVAGLVKTYRSRHRRARLEYVDDLSPLLEPALIRSGFRVEGRLPLMIFDTNPASDLEPLHEIDLVAPTSDDDLYTMASVQAEAYGDDLPERGIVVDRRRALASGSIALVARDCNTTHIVAAGSCSPMRNGLSEVAAIGVLPLWRRRGIATTLARGLALQALGRGAELPWLMAAHESEQRAYERAGFRVAGEILHISYLE